MAVVLCFPLYVCKKPFLCLRLSISLSDDTLAKADIDAIYSRIQNKKPLFSYRCVKNSSIVGFCLHFDIFLISLLQFFPWFFHYFVFENKININTLHISTLQINSYPRHTIDVVSLNIFFTYWKNWSFNTSTPVYLCLIL